MKCRHKNGIISVLVIIYIATIVTAEKDDRIPKRSRKRCLRDRNEIPKNTYETYDSFPSDDYTNAKNHKIVKKQMGALNEINTVDAKRFQSEGRKLGIKALKINSFLEATHRAKRSNDFCRSIKQLPRRDYARKKKRQFYTPIVTETVTNWNMFDKSAKVDDQTNRMICKVPDKSNCHYYFECEMQPNGCIRMVRKRCPGDETFSMKYRECIHLPFRKGVCRLKREVLNSFTRNGKYPDSNLPDPDSEPSNEWLDASQGVVPKIPSEFKPKPKLKLRIYHLRCKKTPKELCTRMKHSRKRRASFGTGQFEPIAQTSRERFSRHNVRRHHPRSFIVRFNKKIKNQDEGMNEDNQTEEDEDDEDDEDDDEEETDEDRDESFNKAEDDKVNCKEGFKDLFKSAKDVVSRIKTPNSQQHLAPETRTKQQYQSKIDYDLNKDESSFHESDKNNKVLIDANIKVDEEVSAALKTILGKSMKKSLKEIL